MDFEGDPFPRSLPQYSSPHIFDADMTETMEDPGFDFLQVSNYGSPSNMYSDDMMAPSTYSSAPPKTASDHRTVTARTMDHIDSQSPESSVPDSSSDSSNQHERQNSSDSSQSGHAGDTNMADTPGANGILIGADPIDDYESNRAMERHFDFDSAASSPVPSSILSAARPLNRIKIPLRSHPSGRSSNGADTHSGRSNISFGASPLSPIVRHQHQWQSNEHLCQSTSNFPNQYVNGALVGGLPQTTHWQYADMPTDFGSNAPNRPFAIQSPSKSMPFASPLSTNHLPQLPRLHIYPLPMKSRVETQIPVKLTLDPLPQGITRLHLQPHNIAKPKLMQKPTPEKSPETLEVYAMLVCTSAMHDPAKKGAALARTADVPFDKDPASAEEERAKALSGGPVKICKGCMERERKRANRKKTKNIEEEELWIRDEAKRTVVFNTHEIRDWQQPSIPKDGDGEGRSTFSLVGAPTFGEGAMQVDIPMRIACYCRHQEEKLGFRVILTIKDHQGNFVAQEITTSIMITDDHKTHATLNTVVSPNAPYSDTAQVPGAGVFSQAPVGSHGPTAHFTRNSYSTTDLQAMQQSFQSQPLFQNNVFATPQISSQPISATMTPRNLSRQASPSAYTGHESKKRKASASSRMRNDLMMTKIDKVTSPGASTSVMQPNAQSFASPSGGIPAFSPNYPTPHGLPIPSAPSRYSTNPPTPIATETNLYAPAQRSQSMENLQSFQNAFSAPVSVQTSRVPSPTSASTHYNDPRSSHAKVLADSLHSVSGATNQQPFPVIHKLTPAEGPKAGGIEVTCLGRGFCQGLEVMFGDAEATTTTFWGESALVCLLPAAVKAGTVAVTFKHNMYSSPPQKPILFTYNDYDEQELMKQALTLLNQSRPFGQATADVSTFTRNVIAQFGPNFSFMDGSTQTQGQNHQMTSSASLMGADDIQAAIYHCLELVDLDDGPYQANFNQQGVNGQSMLHLSASLGYYRLVAGLLARGANPDLRDKNGFSPMHMASLNGHARIIGKLRRAGADPALRSLNGYTPADMTNSQQVRDAVTAFDHIRSRSITAIPIARLSRASCTISLDLIRASRAHSAACGDGVPDKEGSNPSIYGSHPMTPVQTRARSRRNSLNKDQTSADPLQGSLTPEASVYAVNHAMSAWRDQLSAQIQQLQQSVQGALPNLAIPALPPIPNLPSYQAYPVVRRISSLVPQRTPRNSITPANDTKPNEAIPKEADYRWWELLTGATSSPPAYEEIYPEKSRQDLNDKKSSALLAAGEAFMDQKCETTFGKPESSTMIDTVNISKEALTRQQREQLRTAHALKVKRLRSDRNLFFIWIPLLVLVLIAILRDQVPEMWRGAHTACSYIQDRFQRRMVEVL